MESKIIALKNASKVLSVITKIGYTVMLVMMGICAALLLFLGVTGGEISGFTVGQTDIVFFDELAATPAEQTALCSVLLVTGGLFFAIFLPAHRMFREISLTGEPFVAKHVGTVRVIGILTAAMPVVTGLTQYVATRLTETEMPEPFGELPGMVVGAVIFCLSYIVDYGCGIREKLGGELSQDRAGD